MRAVVLSHSNLRRDPRILRQIRWLRDLGFSDIKTVGCGRGVDLTNTHFKVSILNVVSRYLGYLIPHSGLRFKYFYGNQLNKFPVEEISTCNLLITNEIEYIPWINNFRKVHNLPPLYIDLHEDHINDAYRNILERIAFKRFWRWQKKQLVELVTHLITNNKNFFVTTVEDELAKLYSELLSVPVEVIYNSPTSNDLVPSEVSSNSIKLVHHGFGTIGRGIETAVRALRRTDTRFTLDLILFTSNTYKLKILLLAYLLGVRSRVKFRPAVKLEDLFPLLNSYDVGLIILSNKVSGHTHSLPNKFFESLHAKLAVVSGPNPTMSRIIEQEGFGMVLKDWSVNSLAEALRELTPEKILNMKQKAVAAASRYSDLQSQHRFERIVRELLGQEGKGLFRKKN